MTHSHRRKTSRNEWFRMDVPKDIRDLAGTTSWQRSLGTTDPTQAAAERARLSSHFKFEVIRLRAQKAAATKADVADLVRQVFVRLARYCGSMDAAVSTRLYGIGEIVRGSWGLDQYRAVASHHGVEPYDQPGEQSAFEDGLVFDAALAIQDPEQQRLFVVRAELLEREGRLEGIVYQELATALLQRRQFEAIRGEIDYLPCIVPDIGVAVRRDYPAVAEAYLAFLAGHEFINWPSGIRQALAPVAIPAPVATAGIALSAAPISPAPPTVAPAAAGEVHTLRDAFEAWKRQRKIVGENKTADEFETAIERFEALFGNLDVTTITRKMTKSFRDLVEELPSRPKREIAALPLREQIEAGRARNLPTLMPATVGKQMAGLKAALAAAVKEEWIDVSPAEGVTVAGAKWEGDERDHFSDEDMRRIYGSPLMTDPDACDDTMFWILFLAPFHGSRPGEHCKLKPNEIVAQDGEWVMRFRRDRRPRHRPDGTVAKPRRQKTKGSIRDVPLHWIVLEGGFLDLCRFQRERGAEWLFDDLVENAYGDRYAALSRRINRALRKLGIVDVDKAFYSTRHTMKREGRRLGVKASSMDQVTGHVTGHAGDKYGQGTPIETLKDDIDRLEFRSVSWDEVVACARVRIARRFERSEPKVRER